MSWHHTLWSIWFVAVGTLCGLVTYGMLKTNETKIGAQDVVEPGRCKDKATPLISGNTCPTGTFLELENDGDGNRYVVCHCVQPVKITIEMTPSTQQFDPNLEDPDLEFPEEVPEKKHTDI